MGQVGHVGGWVNRRQHGQCATRPMVRYGMALCVDGKMKSLSRE